MDWEAMVMWGFLGYIAVMPMVFWSVAFHTRHAQCRGEPGAASSGGLLGFDELFHATAHNARVQWEAEQELPAGVPSPDKGPGVIESGRRITIQI